MTLKSKLLGLFFILYWKINILFKLLFIADIFYVTKIYVNFLLIHEVSGDEI
jgi:hypothetical protein